MNQVTEKKNGALATFDMEADAQQGAQNISQEDLALPFLKILGQLSPEVNKRDGKYVEGAEPGKIINTVTNALYDSINVVPCHYKRQYIEWQDRGTSTGAPVAIHDADSDIISQTTRGKDYKDRLPNGNYLDNTASHFVLVVGDNPETALISMKSTQLKVSRNWNSLMQDQFETDPKTQKNVPAPMFSRVYKLQSVENSGSFTWHGYKVSMARKVDNASLYQMAKDFHNSLKASNAAAENKEESNY